LRFYTAWAESSLSETRLAALLLPPLLPALRENNYPSNFDIAKAMKAGRLSPPSSARLRSIASMTWSGSVKLIAVLRLRLGRLLPALLAVGLTMMHAHLAQR
jgi:hypothetical protein